MKKTILLIAIISAMPSYASLFCSAITASVIMGLATLVGVILSSMVDTKNEKWLVDKFRLGWAIHLIGLYVVIAVQYFK
jgi:uncharacterized protein YqfA (UPF0365 family)